ncbi:MAG TPA: DUF2855 family protein [Burkholderiaceae bacterium]|nr:DUF2855 family protein [Burkholderiaceae bacterium]
MSTTRFLVRKDQLPRTEWEIEPDAPLQDGEVRVRIDRFALTSNNITYAAFGDAMNYWSFFPVAQEGWGVIPVWGFGDVVQSLHAGVAVGERLYGYFPMASSVVLAPTRLSPTSFSDGAPHRAALHGVYNQYMRCSADPFYTASTEDAQALLRPLYITSWLIDDFLADNAFFGAMADASRPAVMLLSSASSKTAYGTAFQLARRKGIEVVGLTSAANVDFCQSLSCYNRVLPYDQLDQLNATVPCVYIDFAGNAALRESIHTRFTQLAYSCSIGGTHVEQLGSAKNLPGPKAALFFAPAQIKKRQGDWGSQDFGSRLVQAWQQFLAHVTNPVAPWLVPERHEGAVAMASTYKAVLGGQGDPRKGHVLNLVSRSQSDLQHTPPSAS